MANNNNDGTDFNPSDSIASALDTLQSSLSALDEETQDKPLPKENTEENNTDSVVVDDSNESNSESDTTDTTDEIVEDDPLDMLPFGKTEKKEVEPKQDDGFDKAFELPEGQNRPKDAEQWAKYKSIAKERENELQAKLDAAIAEQAKKQEALDNLNQRFKDPAEIEAALADYEDIKKRASLIDLKITPEYRNKIDGPRKEAQKIFDSIATDYELDVKLGDLAKLSGKALDKALDKVFDEADVSVRSQNQIIKLIDATQQIDALEASLVENADQSLKNYQQAENDKYRAALEKNYASFVESAGALMQERKIPDTATAEERAMMEASNKSISGIRAKVENLLFNPGSADDIAKTVHNAVLMEHVREHTFPMVEAIFRSLATKNKELQAKVDGLTSAKHKSSGNFSPANKGEVMTEAKAFDNLKNALDSIS